MRDDLIPIQGLIETVEQDKIIKDAKSIGEFYVALPDNMPHDTKQMTIMMYFFPDEMIKMGGKE